MWSMRNVQYVDERMTSHWKLFILLCDWLLRSRIINMLYFKGTANESHFDKALPYILAPWDLCQLFTVQGLPVCR